MYAIVSACGKQYRVEQGDEIFLEKLGADEGSEYVFEDILAVSADGDFKVGDDAKNAKVKATVLKHGKGKKVIVYKYKSKKDYRKKQGHRQPYTKVRIEEILA